MPWSDLNDIMNGETQGYAAKTVRLYDEITRVQRKAYTFKNSVRVLTELSETIISQLQKHTPTLDTFVIGKTFARKKKSFERFNPVNINTWKLAGGINGRWNSYYKEEGFDGMLVLCAVTRDILPPRNGSGNDVQDDEEQDDEKQNDLYNQQDYVLALEQQLIHYYAFDKQDPRLGNTTLETGKKERNNAMAGVLYLAFRFDREE